jgi:predicted Zn finger-like uncharacterized protein
MKFVCDRCQTKYSIADDKVRGKVLKVRCKTCQNVITVREAGAKPSVGGLAPVRPSQRPSGPQAVPLTGLTESSDEPSERTSIAPAPAGLMADLIGQGRRPTPPPPPPIGDGIEWFLALEGAQQGPFSRRLLVDRLLALPKDADVHVWNDKMDGWKAPRDVTDIANDLAARKPPAAPGRPRVTPSPPVPPMAARRGTQPLASGIGGGVGSKLGLPAPHIAVAHAHAVPAPHAALEEAVGRKTPPPAASTAIGIGPTPAHPSNGAGPAHASGTHALAHASGHVATHAAGHPAVHAGAHATKTNGVTAHAAAPAAPFPGGESDALSALNLGGTLAAKAPAAAPRIMEVGEATAWSGAGRVQEGRHGNTKMVLGLLAIGCVIVTVLALNFTHKTPPVVAAAPGSIKGGLDGDSLAKLHDLAESQKNEPPAVAPIAHEQPAAIEPLRGKGARGRGATRGRQVAARGNTSPGPIAGTSASAAPAAAPQAAAPSGIGRERAVSPVSAVSNRPAPTQAEITRVIANNKLAIKTCYQRALLRDSNLTHGKIVVGVTIGISGRVKGVRVDGPSSFRSLEPCIKEMVGRWTFPQSYEEYGTEFSYLFQGNE